MSAAGSSDARGNLRAWVIYPQPGDSGSGWRPRSVIWAALAIVVLLAVAAALARQRR